MWLSRLFAGERKGPRRAREKPIKVIEKPGADYPAQEHEQGTGHCWCMPDVEYDDSAEVIRVHHRQFVN